MFLSLPECGTLFMRRLSDSLCVCARYDRYNQTCRASHFVFLPFYPKRPAELAVMNVSLSSLEQEEAERFEEWDTVGNAYLLEQNTKVCVVLYCSS